VSPLTVSVIVLWLVVIALCLVVMALARQLGVLHERMGPAGALMLARGLTVGARAPEVAVTDLQGRRATLGASRADGKSTLLAFVSPTCPVCKALLPVLKASAVSEDSWLEIVLASDGDLAEQRAFVERQQLHAFSFIVSAPLGIAYQAGKLPFAALLDEQGILRARGIINSREHLESLFEAKRLGVGSLQEYFERAGQHGVGDSRP
jgi:methylamine dehydrogenase accessory protein MauD